MVELYLYLGVARTSTASLFVVNHLICPKYIDRFSIPRPPPHYVGMEELLIAELEGLAPSPRKSLTWCSVTRICTSAHSAWHSAKCLGLNDEQDVLPVHLSFSSTEGGWLCTQVLSIQRGKC